MIRLLKVIRYLLDFLLYFEKFIFLIYKVGKIIFFEIIREYVMVLFYMIYKIEKIIVSSMLI